MTGNELHGVASQKIYFFLTTGGRAVISVWAVCGFLFIFYSSIGLFDL
jgi:hypothetical protein